MKRQSFTSKQEFSFEVKDRFPELEVEPEAGGTVLVMDIKGSRGLSLTGLAGALRRASRGGIRAAVVTLAGESPTVVTIDRFRQLVEAEISVKGQLGLERTLRACA